MNEINVIAPYRDHGHWMFDDASVGLCREPFVGGADHVLQAISNKLGLGARLRLTFARRPFPDHQFHFRRKRREDGGHVYACEALRMEGWLCPALLCYFASAPMNLYVRAERAPRRTRVKTQEPGAYTKEEVRDMVLDHLRGLAKYWANVDTPHHQTVEDKLNGFAFSVCTMLDGVCMNLPAFDLVLHPHPDDEDYNKAQGERWFEPGMCVNDDCSLHDLYHKQPTTKESPHGHQSGSNTRNTQTHQDQRQAAGAGAQTSEEAVRPG